MTDIELVDAQRLAEALERLEAGIEPDLDPREDPSLSALVALAAEIRDIEELATDSQRYRSYRPRSRDHVLRRVEHATIPRETMPTALVPVVVAEPRRRRVPFLHWSYLAPVASAAAAAVAVLAFIAAQPGAADEPAGGEQTAAAEPAPNAAPTATAAQIDPPSALGSPTVPDRPLPWEVLPPLPTRRPVAADLDRIQRAHQHGGEPGGRRSARRGRAASCDHRVHRCRRRPHRAAARLGLARTGHCVYPGRRRRSFRPRSGSRRSRD